MTEITTPARILVVDDDAFNRDLLEQELDALGHTCLLAAEGKAALEALAARSASIDVVLLDIMMPGVDGFEVLRRMRLDPDLREVPVIVISALSDLPSTVRAIQLGAVDYLPKPCDQILLKARIDACLERSRWRAREKAYLADIEREQARADALLDALLPKDAVREWKKTGAVRPRQLDDVAVMFLDIVGFSNLARSQSPDETMEQLTHFTELAETLTEANGLEKIKLIGDAVMVTGNLLIANPEPVAACIAYARELTAAARGIGNGWRLRGGLAHGTVLAGVIGQQRFSFDLWGPTVNLAARLASLRVPSYLNLDDAARRRLACAADTTPLGDVELHGLGATAVFRTELGHPGAAAASP